MTTYWVSRSGQASPIEAASPESAAIMHDARLSGYVRRNMPLANGYPQCDAHGHVWRFYPSKWSEVHVWDYNVTVTQ